MPGNEALVIRMRPTLLRVVSARLAFHLKEVDVRYEGR